METPNNHATVEQLLDISLGTASAETLPENFDFTVTSEQLRQQGLKALTENLRAQRVLRSNQLLLLQGLSDPEKRERLYHTVCSVHEGILSSAAKAELPQVIETTLQEGDAQFLAENKHTRFYQSARVFDHHVQHPVQKQLQKKKYLGKRGMKKQQTPLQHFNHLLEAKWKLDQDNRLDALEASMLETQRSLVLLANNQVELSQQLDISQKTILHLQETVKDLRKLKLYVIIHQSKKRQTIKQLATELGVSEKTIKRWKRELKDAGFL